MSRKIAVGIDLGSTQSEISIMEHGEPTVIVSSEGSRTFPSVISIDEKGERKVGAAARRQALIHPKETITLIKRFMGRKWDDPETQSAIKHMRYKVVNHKGMPYIKIYNKEYSPQEVSSWILSALKKMAEDYVGEPITDAVITVPALFTDAARTATKEAGELAGLNVLRIINEPTAATLASKLDKSGKYMVTDYGGSTLDNSVVDFDKSTNVMEILASNGNTYLGGADLDNKVADYIVSEFKKSNGIDLSKDPMAMQRIVEAAEKAKMELSTVSSTDINLPYITVSNNTPLHLNVTLNKAKFEQLIKSDVDKVIESASEALKAAKVDKLNGIILVGGSCRIPYVQERLKQQFNTTLIHKADLDLAVAQGASMQANILAGNTSDTDVLLLDVTPLTLGIETLGGVMTPLIEANTTIPTKKSQVFSTATDNQSAVDINVLQGARRMAKDNKSIGTFRLDGIMPARRGIPQIEVTFDIDANGIVSVTAKDKATNKEQHITIQNQSGLSKEEINKIKADAKLHEAEDKKNEENVEKLNNAEKLVFGCKDALESAKDKISDDERNTVEPKLKALEKAIEEKKYEDIDNLVKEVNDAFQPLAAKLYSAEQKETQNSSNQQESNTEDAKHENDSQSESNNSDDNVSEADFEK